MPRAQQVPSSANSPSKAIQQRHYREKESECFDTLRGIIMQRTGEELQTRNEILTKVIVLLSGIRDQGQAQVVAPAEYDVPATTVNDPAVLAQFGYPSQSSDWEQHWQNAGADSQIAYYNASAQSHDQQYYPMLGVDAGFEQPGDQESSENQFNDRQF